MLTTLKTLTRLKTQYINTQSTDTTGIVNTVNIGNTVYIGVWRMAGAKGVSSVSSVVNFPVFSVFPNVSSVAGHGILSLQDLDRSFKVSIDLVYIFEFQKASNSGLQNHFSVKLHSS